MYAKVINGQVTQVGLPATGTLNGNTVSNHHLLPEAALMQEGWLPMRDQNTVYDEATQILEFVEYQITEEEIIAVYTAVDKPEEPMVCLLKMVQWHLL